MIQKKTICLQPAELNWLMVLNLKCLEPMHGTVNGKLLNAKRILERSTFNKLMMFSQQLNLSTQKTVLPFIVELKATTSSKLSSIKIGNSQKKKKSLDVSERLTVHTKVVA